MTTRRYGRLRRALGWAALLAPLATLFGCSSAVSGHAPGVAGGQSLSPGEFSFPLAYIKRPFPKTDIDVRDPIAMTPGGDLYVRDQASAGAPETDVTGAITKGQGDVRDLDVSPDGTKLVFALHLPMLANTPASLQPTWNIYEYDATTKKVTQLTNDDITTGDDIGPHFLPDGRIVFASSRQTTTQAVLLDENRPQYPAQTERGFNPQQSILALHVMNADGTNIHQITFNTGHDFDPSVLNDGQIVFSRWEQIGGTDEINLYRVNPDGTGLELYYGANSHATGANIAGTNDNVIQFLEARQRPDGRLLVIDRPFLGTQLGGDALLIDADQFVEYDQPTLAAAAAAATGPAQMSATALGVTTDANLPSLGGRIASAYPLYDGTNRMLISWSPCLLLDDSVTPPATTVCSTSGAASAGAQMAPPQYTLWLYDPGTGTLVPVLSAAAGTMIVDPVIMQPRSPAPTFLPDTVPSGAAATLADNGVGVLDIRSVYDVDGKQENPVDGAPVDIATLADPSKTSAAQLPIRFIRIEKPVEIPPTTVRKTNPSAYGPTDKGMREILGYAPVQPDGSVDIQVPANVPLTLELLDANGRRVGPEHPSWLQVMPGETHTCNGCHEPAGPQSPTPSHGRGGLTAPAYNGAPPGGFPDTTPSLVANAGETMAETLARSTCVTTTGCSQVLSPDLIYNDVWTNPAVSTPNLPISLLYTDLLTPAPINGSCLPWNAQCRITIEYLQHIQTLWDLPRQTPDPKTGALIVHTCVSCHSPVNAQNQAQVPAGYLDLTSSVSSVDPSVVTSYEDLLFPHAEQQLNMGVLTPVVDPTTGQTVNAPAPMSAGSATASSPFLAIFDGRVHDSVVDHTGFLSPAELRLISEWLDIGAQYYNDPFVAPAAN